MRDVDAFYPRSKRVQLELQEGTFVHDPGNTWQCWGVVWDVRPKGVTRAWQCNCRRRSPVAGKLLTCHRHNHVEKLAQDHAAEASDA